MYKKENSEVMLFYAISPVHAGAGSSVGVVDLPIQRERHTNWPHIQASGVKGAMRAHFDKFKSNIKYNNPDFDEKQLDKITEKIFGSENFENENDNDNKILPGAIAVSDAKLLAFPIRSNIAPFIWVTSPSIIKRLLRDLKLIGIINDENASEYLELTKPINNETAFSIGKEIIKGEVLLEDFEVKIDENKKLPNIIEKFFSKAERLILISDEIFDYAVSNCTEIQTQIKIDQEKGTTEDGSLRYEELLPSDSILYSILMYGNTKDKNPLEDKTLINFLKNDVLTTHIQMGGDETLGRGLFEIDWISKEED